MNVQEVYLIDARRIERGLYNAYVVMSNELRVIRLANLRPHLHQSLNLKLILEELRTREGILSYRIISSEPVNADEIFTAIRNCSSKDLKILCGVAKVDVFVQRHMIKLIQPITQFIDIPPTIRGQFLINNIDMFMGKEFDVVVIHSGIPRLPHAIMYKIPQ